MLAGAAYVLVNTGTAILAGQASTPFGVKAWRLAAWLLSLAVFGIHFAVERRRHVQRPSAAVEVALGVALGAVAVAAFGPLRAHWAEPSRLKLVVLSVIAWPILTGVPAFAVALIGGFVFDRFVTSSHKGTS